MISLQQKEQALREVLQSYGKIAIAFSGGVDSELLLFVAHQELADRVFAITSHIPMTPSSEILHAKKFCQKLGVQHHICEPDVFSLPEVCSNDPQRCYYCKKMLFQVMKKEAQAKGYSLIADGTNTDDLQDYRPGMRAIHELNVVSPFLNAGFSKSDIRNLSRKLNIPTWNRQSNACLATRVPYGVSLTRDLLQRIDKAEQELVMYGFSKVRVRVHDTLARIEIEKDDFPIILKDDNRKSLLRTLRKYGFDYVTLDLDGFRSGSMNKTILTKDSIDG